MKLLSEVKFAKLNVVIAMLILCVLTGFAGNANAFDYRAKFLQECQWLKTQQVTSGSNLGGIYEGEDYTSVVESDNTHEAVWIWSRYAELTGDYTTYQTNINNAWTYLNNNPAWNEGGSITNYYTTYNCAWGMFAEMKYRQVYQGKTGYVDHTAYGRRCASTLHQGNCGTSGSDGEPMILGLAAGSLYLYGVFDSNTVAQADANAFGNSVRTWLNGSSANFKSEAWAISAGAAVWGVLNSYYKANPAGAAAWAANADANMPLNAADGSNNNYEFGHDGWYTWGHYAVSQYLGANSFTKYQNVIDKILSSDNDHDGGIRQGITYGDTSDYAWATDIPQFGVNFGLIGTTNYTVSGTITSNGSPLAGVLIMGLPGSNLADPNSWAVTDANGFYTTQVPAGFYGATTPFKLGYSFSPATITYSNLSSGQTNQNYTASTITPVSIGSWITGTTHSKETGSNRALVFVAHAEAGSSGTPSLTGVTYGGQTMTKITDKLIPASGSSRAYVAAFILNETGINAATTTTFTPTWTSAPSSITYTSVFLQNVNQTILVGAAAGNGQSTVYSVATTPLATSDGDMVIENAVSTATGTYLTTYGWTKDVDLSVTGYDGIDAHKAAAGVNETPCVTQASAYQSIIGYAIKVAAVSLPGKAATPNPANSSTGVNTTQDISWSAGSGATSRDVYFGTANPPVTKVIADGTALTYDTGTMNYNTTYYWRVDEKNSAGTTTGDVWSFTTTAPPQYTLTVNTVGGGTITKDPNQSTYTSGSVVTLTANAAIGWTFTGWSGDANGSANPTTVTMNGNKTVTATFTQNDYTLTVNIVGSGSVTKTPSQPTYHYGDIVQLQANAVTGWSFSAWSGNLSGSTNPQNLTITGNMSVTATFTINTFTLVYNAGVNGTITGTSPQTVNYNANGSAVTAVPNTGYHFVKWSDDKTDNPRTDSAVTANITVTAEFAIDTFTLVYNAGVNGSVTGTSPQTVNYNANGSAVTAVPNTGYHFVKWSDDKTDNPRTDSAVTANITVTAQFAIDTFTVSVSAGENGSIEPSGDMTKDYSSSQLLTATPATGYEVDKWQVDGFDVQTGGTTYTLSDITAGHTVSVIFKQIIFSISGYIFEPDGNTPVVGTLVSAGDINATTDANGYYTLQVAYGWSGVVAPQMEGYAFEPNSDTYTSVTQNITDANYTAEMKTFVIDGHVFGPDHITPISDVNVVAENGGGRWTAKYGGGNAKTDKNGYYRLVVDYNYTGNVTPDKYAYAFAPADTSYAGVLADQPAQDYIGTLMTFKITGYIKNGCNVPIPGVVVSANNGGGQGTTNAEGLYEIWVDYAWSGAVTSQKQYYTFAPPEMDYTQVLANKSGQNYTANNVYDLDCDSLIGLGDIGVMAQNWLLTGSGLAGDLNGDGQVNFLDFADFANIWTGR